MSDILHDHHISPLARRFAPLSTEAYERFKRSIAKDGQRVPIARRDGVVYDGVHRLRACLDLGLEPRFIEIGADVDLLRFVIAQNAHRRDNEKDDQTLTAFLFSEGSTPGRPRSSDENEVNLTGFLTVGEAAETFGISESKLKQARKVLMRNGPAVPELRQAVLEWRIKVSDASRIVNQPAEVQRQAVERKLKGQVRTVLAGVRQIDAEMRDKADTEAGEAVLSLPIDDTLRVMCSHLEDLCPLVDAESVDLIATFPPTAREWVGRFVALAEFGLHALAPGGLMAVMVNADLLPQILNQLDARGLDWITEFDYRQPNRSVRMAHPHRAVKRRLPILLYGKPGCRLPEGSDFIEEPPRGESPQRSDTELLLGGMEALVRRLVRPGQLVCDPVTLGRENVALSVKRHGCRFIGAADTELLRKRLLGRLARAEERPTPGHGGPTVHLCGLVLAQAKRRLARGADCLRPAVAEHDCAGEHSEFRLRRISRLSPVQMVLSAKLVIVALPA